MRSGIETDDLHQPNKALIIPFTILLFLLGQIGLSAYLYFAEAPTRGVQILQPFIVLSLLFAAYNGAALGKDMVSEIPLELLSMLLPSALLYYFIKQSAKPRKLQSRVLAIGLTASLLLTLLFWIFAKNLDGIQFVHLLPILTVTFMIVGILFSLTNKEDGKHLQNFVHLLLVMGLGFAALAGSLLLDVHYQHLQLTENMVYFIVGLNFLSRYRRLSRSVLSGTILDPDYVDSDPYNLNPYGLTPTQKQIAIGLIEGLQPNEIALYLDKAPETIHRHASDVYKKTHCAPLNEFLNRFRPKNARLHPKPSFRKHGND